MNQVKLYVEGKDNGKEILFRIRRMVNGGYTGRNQEAVRKHIEELKSAGITSPESIPAAYEVITELIYFDSEIEVIGDKTSGEAEFVLLCTKDDVYVGVGSDHTDRELEAVSIIKSKQVCPNLLSSRVWNLKDVNEDWDEMILRSWVKTDEGKRVLYQEAPLATLMTPQKLMAFVANKMSDKNLDGVVIYSGTIPILTKQIYFSSYFEVELYNPMNDKKLRCSYKVKVLDYLKGHRQ